MTLLDRESAKAFKRGVEIERQRVLTVIDGYIEATDVIKDETCRGHFKLAMVTLRGAIAAAEKAPPPIPEAPGHAA